MAKQSQVSHNVCQAWKSQKELRRESDAADGLPVAGEVALGLPAGPVYDLSRRTATVHSVGRHQKRSVR